MKKNAFSMVELSIVLIIIGLLVASVSAGTKIVGQAKLRQVLAEITSYRNAVNAFVSTYEQLPGDFNNASSFWGSTSPCSTSANYCNGNGDGEIDWNDAAASGDTVGTETAIAIKHLTLSKIAQFSFASTQSANSQTHYPALSRFSENSCMFLVRGGDLASYGSGGYASGGYQSSSNMAEIGNAVLAIGEATDFCNNKIFTPVQADSIDLKIDDGQPLTGTTRVRLNSSNNVLVGDPGSGNANCVNWDGGTADTVDNADTYNIAYQSAACNLVVKVY